MLPANDKDGRTRTLNHRWRLAVPRCGKSWKLLEIVKEPFEIVEIPPHEKQPVLMHLVSPLENILKHQKTIKIGNLSSQREQGH